MDVALPLQVGEMLVDRGQRLELEVLGDFLEAGGVAVVPDIALEVGENFALALGERHCPGLVGVTERMPN
jgi:hypothetical protein